jgi:DNA methylase
LLLTAIARSRNLIETSVKDLAIDFGVLARREKLAERHARLLVPLAYLSPRDIVIDPFLGSGSTLIASERTGRACHGVELDPLYIDVIVRSYESATGRTAILAGTGETFKALTARRMGEPTRDCSKGTRCASDTERLPRAFSTQVASYPAAAR